MTEPDDPRTEWLLIVVATDQTPAALDAVADERLSQVEKWGVQSLPDGTGGQWAPAAAEARRITDLRFAQGVGTWTDVLLEEVFEAIAEDDPDLLRAELVQVAAVATSWIEDLDRKHP